MPPKEYQTEFHVILKYPLSLTTNSPNTSTKFFHLAGFAKLTISIIGDVAKPGRYDINKDQLTLFEALALAGDLTIYGDRENVAVIREKDGKSIVTKLDLRSQDIFSSPCFYIEQNDVIIVSPNKYKAATSEINANRSFWVSLTSTGISLATLLLTIFTLNK